MWIYVAGSTWAAQALQYIEDNVAPVITNKSPANGATGIQIDTDIVFDVTDPTTGVLPSSVVVYITPAGDSTFTAYQNQTFLGLYDNDGSSRTTITDGYRFTFNPALREGVLYTVRAVATDPRGNEVDESWSFTSSYRAGPPVFNDVGYVPTGGITPTMPGSGPQLMTPSRRYVHRRR